MTSALYRQGNRLVWIGFLGLLICRSAQYLGSEKTATFVYFFVGPNLWYTLLRHYVSLMDILSFGAIGILFVGCGLILRSKHRSLAWLFAVLGLIPVLGFWLVYILEDNSRADKYRLTHADAEHG